MNGVLIKMQKFQRNDACWCGSGKKYKNCHMAFDEKVEHFEDQGYHIAPYEFIKNEEQIEGIRKSGRATTEILDIVEKVIKAGMSTEEINTIVHEETLKRGGTPAPLGYQGYPKSTCTSVNNVICHGIPSENHILKDGDIINVDVTTILNGYYADASRMFMIGEVTPRARKIVEVTKEAMEKAIQNLKPWGDLNEVGRTIEPFVKSHGYSVVRALCGHGVGLEFHEEPQVDHYSSKEKGYLLVPGMTFTIEPMINEGTYDCIILEDKWTVVTKDKKLSAQWENTVLVTETGIEILAR